MRKGDQCFFYHSNIGKEIVGIVEIIKEAYLDKTDKSGRFVAVTVKFKQKLNRPVTLLDIKKNEAGGLSEMRQRPIEPSMTAKRCGSPARHGSCHCRAGIIPAL